MVSEPLSQKPRALSAIAREIRKEWPKPYFGAVPYIQSMSSLDSIDDYDFNDSAVDVVRRFLVNASHWRGDAAKRIKAELREMLKGR